MTEAPTFSQEAHDALAKLITGVGPSDWVAHYVNVQHQAEGAQKAALEAFELALQSEDPIRYLFDAGASWGVAWATGVVSSVCAVTAHPDVTAVQPPSSEAMH